MKEIEARKMMKAIQEVHKSFEAEGLAWVPLEALVPDPEDAEEEEEEEKQGEAQEKSVQPKMTPEDLTRERALKKDHLLLPRPLATQACKLCAQLVSTFHSPEKNRITSLWQKFLFPTAERALEHIKKEEFQLAFGELLGLLLFASQEASWVLDKQAIADWIRFCSLFEDLSFAWAAVLARADPELGLAPAGGREGGYRKRVVELLKVWEQETNQYLMCLDTPFGEASSSWQSVPLWRPGPALARLSVAPVPLSEK